MSIVEDTETNEHHHCFQLHFGNWCEKEEEKEGDPVGLEHGCLKNGGGAVERTTPN